MRLRFILAFILYLSSISLLQAKDWIYTVQKDDNLWDIASKYLLDISYAEKIQKLNNISNPKQLLPNSKIKIPKNWIRHFPSLIRVISLQGSASFITDNSALDKPLAAGSIIVLGDTIITYKNSTIAIGFIDGSTVLLEENSRLKINRLLMLENTGMLDSHLKLEAGRMEIKAAHDKSPVRQFTIETPTAITSVRGTHYRISSEKKSEESRAEVLEGNVEINGAGKKRNLHKGFGTIAVKNKAPLPPIKLLPSPDTSSIPNIFDRLPLQFTMPAHDQGQNYRVLIAKSKLFYEPLINAQFDSEIITMGEFPDGDYFLKIRGIDSQKLEGINATKKFTVNVLPEAPFQISPKSGTGILLEKKPSFGWSKQKNSNNYHFQISKNNNFSTLEVDKKIDGTNEITVPEKLGIGKHYWRVAAVDQDGDGPFSDSQLFRIILPSSEFEAPDISDDVIIIHAGKGLPGQTFQFQFSATDDFSTLLIDEVTTKPTLEIPTPDNGGEYFIRMRTINPDGFVGPFNTPQSIDIPYNLYWLLTLLPLLALLAL